MSNLKTIMRKSRYLMAASCVMLFVLYTSLSFGVIFIDEDFDGASVLVNQNFPFKAAGAASAIDPPIGADLNTQGINILTNDQANWDLPLVLAGGGTRSTARRFQGAGSYQLASGTSLATTAVPNGTLRYFHLMQFALSVSDDTLLLAPGTEVGHFKWDYSTNTTDQVQSTMELVLKVNNQQGVDLLCVNKNDEIIGTLISGTGSWLLLSMIANINIVESLGNDVYEYNAEYASGWHAWDPITSTFKGPQPADPSAPNLTMTTAEFDDWNANNAPQIAPGINIFVNSNNLRSRVHPDDLGEGWGSDNGTLDPVEYRTAMQGFEIAAKNGGTLYIDNLHLNLGLKTDIRNGVTQHMAARTTPFDAVSVEGAPASAMAWELY